MLCVTVLSAVEAIKEAGVSAEIVVVENSDEEVHQAAIACLAGQIKEGVVRVIREKSPSIALSIDRSHNEARGEFLFYTDSHTLIGTGTISALLDFFDRHEGENIGFVYAPIQWAHTSSSTRRTHMNVKRSKLGEWDGSQCAIYEQKVPWKGMPYMVKKETWLSMRGFGCCAEHKLGWGVLAYIGIKSWILGYENWAIPCGVVYHFGEWPEIVKPYANYRTYQISGHHPGLGKALALYVFGGPKALVDEYDSCDLGRFFKSPQQALAECERIGSMDREWILENQIISWDELFSNPPWDESSGALISGKYKSLNRKLHADKNVKYGYKGADQAGLILQLISERGYSGALDYGAGKQGLSKKLKESGIIISDYDPAIPAISHSPIPADLVVCSDVLEHVEPEFLANVLTHIKKLSKKAAFFRVCTVPCVSKKLPDGSDPHRIVQPIEWWMNELSKYFELIDSFERNDKYFSVLMTPISSTKR